MHGQEVSVGGEDLMGEKANALLTVRKQYGLDGDAQYPCQASFHF